MLSLSSLLNALRLHRTWQYWLKRKTCSHYCKWWCTLKCIYMCVCFCICTISSRLWIHCPRLEQRLTQLALLTIGWMNVNALVTELVLSPDHSFGFLISDTTWPLFLEGATSWPCRFMVLCDSEWCTVLGCVSPSPGNIMCVLQPLGSGKDGMSRFTQVFNIHVWWNYLVLLSWPLVCLTSNWNAPGLSPCTYFVFYPNSLTLWCHPVPWP